MDEAPRRREQVTVAATPASLPARRALLGEMIGLARGGEAHLPSGSPAAPEPACQEGRGAVQPGDTGTWDAGRALYAVTMPSLPCLHLPLCVPVEMIRGLGSVRAARTSLFGSAGASGSLTVFARGDSGWMGQGS